jgi:flagellar hook protein FlgE
LHFFDRVLTMASISSIALSGMNAAQTQLNAAAHNVANVNTAGFSRQQVVQSERAQGGVAGSVTTSTTAGASLESDVVMQLQAKNAFLANLAVFKTQDKMAGTLLNQKA